MHVMEQINRRTWRSPFSRFGYGRITGAMDDGERAAFELAREKAGGRVLDIGVGGGRTTALLAGLASGYVGIDYTAEMVAIARRNHPGQRFEHMDARDLSAFADQSFDLAVFSCNGIDSVDPPGRAAILCEVARVLAPGGLFVFSTFHRDWIHFRDHVHPRRIGWTANPVRLGFRLFRFVEGGLVSAAHIRRLLPLEYRDEDHAILLHWAHDFGILVYATTPPRMQGQLARAGFETPAIVIGQAGQRIAGEASAEDECFHLVARKPVPQ